MKLDPATQARASAHLTEMVGSVIGVILLAADDLEATKNSLRESIDTFPEALREMAGEGRTFVLMESTRQVRTHAREFYRILEDVARAKAEEAGLSPEEAQVKAMEAVAAGFAAERPQDAA